MLILMVQVQQFIIHRLGKSQSMVVLLKVILVFNYVQVIYL